MRIHILAAMPLFTFLAACGGGDVEQPDDGVVLLDAETGSGPTGPGSWDVLQDGEVIGSTRIEPDGRYTETYAIGEQATGRIRRDGRNRICFDPDDGGNASGFSEGDPRAEGSFDVVSDEGWTATIRPAG